MVTLSDYGQYETAWCPGCGNFPLLKSLKEALGQSGLAPHQVLLVSGIGQAAKLPHYMKANVFNGLHGRALPAATGAKIANNDLAVIVTSGDGCSYGEGGNHLLSAIRRNIDITLIVHNNQVYGLTKGQASPTSEASLKTKAQPYGPTSDPFNPIALAVGMKASFVARGFVGKGDHLTKIIKTAIAHKGFSLVDVLQPCVSFNKINTYQWYNERCYEIANNYDPENWEEAIKLAHQWEDKIPIGIIYRNNKTTFNEKLHIQKNEPLIKLKREIKTINDIMNKFR